MKNAAILHGVCTELGLQVYGGTNAPYVWVRFPGWNSWDIFDLLLEKGHLICAPGSGFGPSGEGFIRLSAFGKRSRIQEGGERLRTLFSSISR